MELRDLDLLSYAEKVWHFSSEKPWSARRGTPGQYKQVTIPMGSVEPFFWLNVVTDRCGNVLSMPKLIGRPCFGIVTAYLRHGCMDPVFIRRQQKTGPSKCGRCRVQSACHNLAKDRIHSTPQLLAAYEKWKLGGGRKMFNSHLQLHANQGSFTAFVQLARTTIFTSSNDKVVADYYAKRDADMLEKDRIRKIAERRMSRKKGVVDRKLVEQSLEERNRRRALLDEATKHPSRPYWMSKLAPNSSSIIADAWLAQYLLSIAHRPITPGQVAKAMMSRKSYQNWNKNSLRSRLRKDLVRVAQLEALVLPGEQNPVWDKFDPP